MNHRSGLRKLNITDGAHRRAMLRNMSNSLIRHERIKTTLIRAKELRRFLEPLVTISKTGSVANRRLIFSRLRDRDSVTKLCNDIGVRNADRPGGYLRIIKYGYRRGDNAMMALIEFVERVDEPQDVAANKPAAKKAKPKKRAAKPAAKAEAKAEEAKADEQPAAENEAREQSEREQ